MAGALAIFVGLGLARIHTNAATRDGHRTFLEGDTAHYLDIARTFARGDFSMSYVQARPHRQPLYPLLLAPIFRWGGGTITSLAAVNLALAALTFVVIHRGLLHRFRSRLVAAIVGGLFLVNPFVDAQVTQHLLTEPLHLLLAVGGVFAILDYLVTRRAGSLLMASALAGLDYLARPNGLFVMIAMVVALLVDLGGQIFRDPETRSVRVIGGGLGLIAAAAGVFVLVSAPSWIPRIIYFGNPIHHGYLSNYLWVDSYAKGHVGQRLAIYTWHDYFAAHGARDVVWRMLGGIWECLADIPTRIERPVPGLFMLASAGVGLILWRGSNAQRILLLFAGLQILPLAWTNLSNPTVRVPYAASLPFELVFAAIGVKCLLLCSRKFLPALAGRASEG